MLPFLMKCCAKCNEKTYHNYHNNFPWKVDFFALDLPGPGVQSSQLKPSFLPLASWVGGRLDPKFAKIHYPPRKPNICSLEKISYFNIRNTSSNYIEFSRACYVNLLGTGNHHLEFAPLDHHPNWHLERQMIRKMPCASRLPNSCWMLRSLEDGNGMGKDFLLGKFPMFFF